MKLFLCGDVMTGRGIDQVLRHPSDPALRLDGAGRLLVFSFGMESSGIPPAWAAGARQGNASRDARVAEIAPLLARAVARLAGR